MIVLLFLYIYIYPGVFVPLKESLLMEQISSEEALQLGGKGPNQITFKIRLEGVPSIERYTFQTWDA